MENEEMGTAKRKEKRRKKTVGVAGSRQQQLGMCREMVMPKAKGMQRRAGGNETRHASGSGMRVR